MGEERSVADMTRKTIAFIISAALLLASVSAPPAQAQYREGGPATRPISLVIDIGYVNLFTYPKWITLGPELELRLGRLVTINPEVSVWLSQTFRGKAKVVPGATVNLRLKRFFVGAGAVRRISDWAENAGGTLVPKIQAGYLSGPARLTLSALYLNKTKDVVIGLTMGFGIGRRGEREPDD
jgi:hypothetical protein